MSSLQQLRDSNGGELPAYAWPGGYPIVYLCDDGEILCPDCANRLSGSATDERRLVAHEIYFEGPALLCSHCNEEIASACGDQDEDEIEPF